MYKNLDLDFIVNIPKAHETIYLNNGNINLNKKLAFKLLNVFPTQKLKGEVFNIVSDKRINVSEWLLNRIVTLANYDYDILEDECNSRKLSIDYIPYNSPEIKIDIKLNKKLFILGYILKVVNVLLTNARLFHLNKEEKDAMFVQFFYEMVAKTDCIDILDEIVDTIIKRDSVVEEVFYDGFIEYRLITYFISRVVYNPITIDLKTQLINNIQCTKGHLLNNYRDLIYRTYDKKYSEYIALKNYSECISYRLSGTNIREKFEHALDKLITENYSDFVMNELLKDIVNGYDYCRPEVTSDQLFETFMSKYKFVGKVYHGSRDVSGRNRNKDYLVSKYREGSISSSKSIKEAMNFAKFETCDFSTNNTVATYGFVAEINITEDMIALDIEQMLLDLREKHPGISSWISDRYVNEKEVLILAEYIKDANIMTYEEAEELLNSKE